MTDDAVKEIAKLAREGMDVQREGVKGIPFVRNAEDGTPHQVEWALEYPVRKRGCPIFHDCNSFIRYVKEHKDDFTRIFADGGMRVEAVIDYHSTGEDHSLARWGAHRAVLSLCWSEAWKLWTGSNNKNFSQHDFATFLEDNTKDIAFPDGASILEMALGIEGSTTANFSKAIRLHNGNVELHYVEQTTLNAGPKGKLEIPRGFALGIPIFKGEPATTIEAKLRYRIEGGTISFRYELVRPQEAIDHAVDLIIATIAKETTIDPFRGNLGSPINL